MRVYENLVSGLRSYASLRLLTQILSWVGTVYVVRRLGSHAVGEYAVALVIFNYLAMTFDGTLLETLVQRPPTPETQRAVFSMVAGIGAILAAATVVMSGVVGQWVKDPAVAPLLTGVAAAFFLMSFGVIPQAAMARRMEFPRLAGIAAIQSICVTGTTVILAARGEGALSLVWGLLVGAFVRVTLMNVSNWGVMWPTLRVGPALGYLGFGGVLFADNLLWRWYTSIDTFLLGRWAGTTSLGYYNLAQQVAELPLEKITTVVNDISQPAEPKLSRFRRESGEIPIEPLEFGPGILRPPPIGGEGPEPIQECIDVPLVRIFQAGLIELAALIDRLAADFRRKTLHVVVKPGRKRGAPPRKRVNLPDARDSRQVRRRELIRGAAAAQAAQCEFVPLLILEPLRERLEHALTFGPVRDDIQIVGERRL